MTMSRNDQVKNLMSPQETKLYRRIEHLCHFAFRDPKTMDHSSPALRVFSNIPLSQLVNKWDDYARTKLLDVWQVTQKDLQPRASVDGCPTIVPFSVGMVIKPNGRMDLIRTNRYGILA